jgi:hypothetical protein
MLPKNRFIFLQLIIIVMATLFSACRKEKKMEISSADIERINGKYNAETINFFYETVFHEDFNATDIDNLHKWKANPRISLAGNPSPADTSYVNNAISIINGLALPIKCALSSQKDTNSIEIFFGNVKEVGAYLDAAKVIQKDVDTTHHFGLARSISYDGVLSKALIGICFNENDTRQSVRENIVLEEIIQSLGLTGDSYTYTGSLFFQNDNPAKSFTKLDHDALSLLYDPSIPINYPRKSFEKDFANVLYHVNSDEKIQSLLNKYPKELYSGGDLEACFIDGELLKHPKETAIQLYGSIQKEDYAIVSKAITSINKISPDLKLSLVQSNSAEPDFGIVLNLKQMDQQKEAIQRTVEVIKGKDCMFPKLIKSKVMLSFNGSENSKKFREQSIVDALYFALVQLPQAKLGKNKLFKIEQHSIEFDQYYSDLLRLIYSNEFVDGLKLDDFKRIKSTMDK